MHTLGETMRDGPRPGRYALLFGLAAAGLSAAVVMYKARKAEADHPPRGRFVEADGVRLHYIERGLGTPLVLLHGNGTYAEDFDASGLLDLAAQRYRVIAFDRPGFGYSERPRNRLWTPRAQAQLLDRALEKLGVAEAVVLGHSWGTLVALEYALLYPDKVCALVLLSGYHYPTLRLDVPLMSAPAIPVVGDLMRYTLSPWLGRLMWPRLLRRLFDPNPLPSAARALPPWMALRPGQLRASAADSALMIPSAIGLMKRYVKLEVPVHLVAGSADRYVSTRWQSRRLHRQLPRSSLREIPGAGHMVHHVAPQDVLAAIDAAAREAHVIHEQEALMHSAQAAKSGLATGGDIYEKLKDRSHRGHEMTK